jgi:N6-L-threonylcarbamoyladenine synthase
MFVLGLESSCDDCSAAVIRETSSGPELLSMTRKSQDDLHGPYGGVVPELAAREHLLRLREVISEALIKAGLTIAHINKIAVTQGPGLIGSLLTTFTAGKALAWHQGIPWVGVHHIIGHLNAARFAYNNLPFPALALIVSGGHTHLYLATSWTHIELLQKTRDDAAGEAFDKTARMLNLGYPGGPIVDICAKKVSKSTIYFKPPKFRDGKASWSFSGLKTAMKLRINADLQLSVAGIDDPMVQDLCNGFQEAVADWLMKPIASFKDNVNANSLIVSGGVACNSRLRIKAMEVAKRLNLALAIPEPKLCTDNGAMIASAGALLEPLYPICNSWSINADPNMPLTLEE